MAQDSGQERTEQPTQKRLQESREKGQIPRSREFGTMAMLLVGGLGLFVMGDSLMQGSMDILRDGFTINRNEIFDVSVMFIRFKAAMVAALLMLAPFFAILLLVALLSPLALGGWSFSAEALSFKFEKMDPIKGLGRIFGWKGIIELTKALAKFSLVGAVAVYLLWSNINDFLGLANESIESGFAHAGHLLAWSFLLLAGSMIVVALIDVPFQLWDHQRQLKMTRQEIKDEYKQTDGSPEVKGKIRRLQHEMAQKRMMQQVPKADVVITNPTHFAVALKYDQSRMGAPRVIATGVDLIALKIRSIASEHNVMIVESPPLARALYYSTKLDQEIPAGLYLAVAKVLAYVYQLDIHLKGKGSKPNPLDSEDLPIPDDLKKDE